MYAATALRNADLHRPPLIQTTDEVKASTRRTLCLEGFESTGNPFSGILLFAGLDFHDPGQKSLLASQAHHPPHKTCNGAEPYP